MTNSLVRIEHLTVRVDSKVVVDDLEMELGEKQVVALLGANGSGKSSFAQALMGDPRYEYDKESVVMFKEEKLLAMSCDERARVGMFLGWQSPIAIPGVSVFSLCKSSYEARGQKIEKLTDFKIKLEKIAERVGLSKDHINRSINDGFSGGEKKRMELLQLILLQPKVAILDEIDSGLDVDGLKMVADVVKEMKKKGTSFILITHYKKLLDFVEVDKIHVMRAGKIMKTGGIEIAREIEEMGYGRLSTRL